MSIKKFESFSNSKPISRIENVKHIIDDLDLNIGIHDAWILEYDQGVRKEGGINNNPYRLLSLMNGILVDQDNFRFRTTTPVEEIPKDPNFLCYGLVIDMNLDEEENERPHNIYSNLKINSKVLDEFINNEENRKDQILKKCENDIAFFNALKRIIRLDPSIIIYEPEYSKWGSGVYHLEFM